MIVKTVTLADSPSPAELIPRTEIVYSVPISRSVRVSVSWLEGRV